MAQQRNKVIFKIMVVLVCIMLATYAGLFLAYQQLLSESTAYTEHLASGIQMASAKLPR
jgi:hypothetical protein